MNRQGELNVDKFYPIYSDIDCQIYERNLMGRVTKGSYKKLSKLCRKKSYRIHCGCEPDCCGCLFAEEFQLSILTGLVTGRHIGFKITWSKSFNY